MTAATNSLSQEKVELSKGKTTFKNVFAEIRKQTGHIVMFNSEMLNKDAIVNVNTISTALTEILNDVLEGTGLTFKLDGEFIILYEKPAVQQDKKLVKGKVTDVKGGPIPGANVILQGYNTGTITDSNGEFVLDSPDDTGVIRVSFIGFKIQNVPFKANEPLEIILEEEVSNLDEVAVVAYGTTTKREMTGSISTIKAKELEGIPAPNLATLLQGRVAGMDVTNMSGSPGGGGTSITIRGFNSLGVEQERRYSDPLWVVDGVPLNSFTSPITGTNTLSDINPDMIESIQVLKDASSTSLYGSRAANGVIVVTTKRGQKNQEATFNINFSQSWGFLPEYPTITGGRAEREFRMQALREYRQAYIDPETNIYTYPNDYLDAAEFFNDGARYDYYWNLQPGGANGDALQDSLNTFYNNSTDWMPVYFQTAKITNGNIQTYGGNDKTRYSLGLGYYDEEGILKATGYSRMNVLGNINIQPTEKINVDARFYASASDRKRASGNVGREELSGARAIEVMPGSAIANSTSAPGKGSVVYDNLMEELHAAKEDNKDYRFRTNFKINYQILDGLSFSTALAIDYMEAKRNLFLPSSLDVDGRSMSLGEVGKNYMILNENLLHYNKVLKAKHKLDFLLGQSYQFDRNEYNGGYAKKSPSDLIHYALPGFPDYELVTDWQGNQQVIPLKDYQSDMTEKSLLSYFTRFEYSFDDKYMVSLAMRADGSSVFGAENKWGYFPSVAGGWNFSEEGFMDWASFLSFGKIRASWGRTGKDFAQRYLALGVLEASPNPYLGNSVIQPSWFDGMLNPELSWEETDQYDIGLDIDFWDYRLGIVFDYYYRYTDKLLYAYDLPGDYSGYNSQWKNAAATSNEGFELMIKADIIRKKDFFWRVSVNGARNWNKFRSTFNDKDLGNFVLGMPLNGIWGYKTDGYINDASELPIHYTSRGVGSPYSEAYEEVNYYKPGDYYFVDVNGDGVMEFGLDSNDRVFLGSTLPKINGGVVSEVKWKNFDANLSMAYTIGRKMINATPVISMKTDQFSILSPLRFDLNEISTWEKPGDDTDFHKIQYNYRTGMDNARLDRNIEDVNYLKLKTLSIGYSLPKKLIEKWHMQQVRFFWTGENLLTWTNYSGMDPETVDIISGYDNGRNYPLARKFTLGVSVKL
jgi:TonB-linked SusC/RagA family outer membrane protein